MTSYAPRARYAPGQRWRCRGAPGAGGFLGAAVVAVVNATIAEKGAAPWPLAVAFFVLLAVMHVSQQLAVRSLVGVFEAVHAGLQDELSARLRAAPLRAVEQLDDRLGQAVGELAALAGAIEPWVGGVQNLTFLACVTLIVASISVKAWLLWMVAMGAAVLFLTPRLRRIRAAGQALGESGGVLAGRVEQLLDGFVQVKLDSQIAAGITDDVLAAAEQHYRAQWGVRQLGVLSLTGAILLVYLLSWGPAAFADPAGLGLGPDHGYALVAIVELSLGPLFRLFNALPEWARAEAAARSIAATLDALPLAPAGSDEPAAATFEALELVGARFGYATDGAEFVVGPVDLTIRRGELTFITGGNGSGKTTLMKMLLGLYPLDAGRVRVDGQAFDPAGDHRALFTAIFAHQHLFTRLYGLEEAVSPAQVDALLERFGIAGSVRRDGRGFGRIDLSTGQRMRLAMVVALLEDRPICVFDEWTANQDPETTRFYYDTLLPELIAAGKTVIAVSHDDRFFDRADRVIVLDGGRVVAVRRPVRQRSG